MNPLLLLSQLRRADARRPGMPGEHWATFGLGMALLRTARAQRSPVLRTAGWIGAALLVVRAVTGRDGLLARRARR